MSDTEQHKTENTAAGLNRGLPGSEESGKPFILKRRAGMSDAEQRKTENIVAGLNRVLPCSEEAEKAFISGLIHDPSRIERYRDVVPIEALYLESCQHIYQALRDQAEDGRGSDVVALMQCLRDRGQLEKIGAGTISEIAVFLPVPAHWHFYRKRVMADWVLRKQIRAASLMIEMAYEFNSTETTRDITDYVRDCEGLMFETSEAVLHLDDDRCKRDFKTQNEVLTNVIEEFGRVLEHQGSIQPDRVPTGFTDLDRMTGGGKGGQVFIVAARPAMGKTSLATNAAHNAGIGVDAMDYVDGLKHITGKTGAMISLEMSSEEIMMREYVGGAGIDMQTVRHGIGLRQDQVSDLVTRQRMLSRAKLHWLDVAGLSWQELRSKLRSLKTRLLARGEDLHFAVIDYLQLLKSHTAKARGNREIEISEISAGLKMIAKELGIFMIVLAQLNRKAEDRPNGEPELSDLRESGSIEQDADMVGLLWRPHYYNDQAPEDMAVLKIAKHRGGPVGSILLSWEGARTQFHSTCDHLHSNNPENQQKPIPEIPPKRRGTQTEQPPADAQTNAKPNYSSKDYKGPRGRPRKDNQPPLEEIFPD